MTSLLRDFPFTDAGNSERLILLHGKNIRYVPEWESWIAWQGGHGAHWKIDRAYLFRMAELTARSVYGEAGALPAGQAALKKSGQAFARKSESARAIRDSIELAQHRAGVTLSHTVLNSKPMLLPVRNGTVELKTGKLRPSEREDYATLTVPIKYDEKATCPTWEAFLKRAMGDDEELVSFVQRCIGYSLTGGVGEHVLFFNYGPKGSNGKSTFLNVLREMGGGYAVTAPRKLLFHSPADRHPTELTTLFGKRIACCSEVPENQVFDEALVKDLTGGETITAHRMHEDFWEFVPTHKFWLAGNHKPIITGTDGGIWRRIVLIPWVVQIPEDEVDLTLPERLRAELPGILAWGVRGCQQWQKQRLAPPWAVRKATRNYRRESDLTGEYFRQFCAFEESARVAKRRLRQAYEQFCEDIGTTPLGAQKFYRRLREQGCDDTSVREKDPGTGIPGPPVDGWTGVRMLTKAEKTAIRRWDPLEPDDL